MLAKNLVYGIRFLFFKGSYASYVCVGYREL